MLFIAISHCSQQKLRTGRYQLQSDLFMTSVLISFKLSLRTFFWQQHFVSIYLTVYLSASLGILVKRSSGNVFMRLSKGVTDYFPLTPSNLVDNSVLTHVSREENHVGPENVQHYLQVSVNKRLKQSYKTKDLLEAFNCLVLVFLEIWIDLHIFTRKQNMQLPLFM